jgi:hypothetical protein
MTKQATRNIRQRGNIGHFGNRTCLVRLALSIAWSLSQMSLFCARRRSFSWSWVSSLRRNSSVSTRTSSSMRRRFSCCRYSSSVRSALLQIATTRIHAIGSPQRALILFFLSGNPLSQRAGVKEWIAANLWEIKFFITISGDKLNCVL